MIIANRYEVIQSLGSGGFGDTFLAKDTQMPSGKQVVIKRLKPAHQHNISIELIQQLFEREAKVLEELGQNCQQIPTLYAYFVENEEFYLVQEYIEGKSLAELGTIHHSQCESILSSLLNTLKYVHGKNIIHRDIKPENIIIRESDKLPVLIDFGAVKESMGAVSLSSGSTVSSVIVGTRGFIPPEQSLGRAVLSSDLYALSLTMIYSLTGKYPIEISNNNITGELDWQSYIPNLPLNLKMVLEKASKIDLSQRYPTSQAMYEALHMSEIKTVAVIPQKSPINFAKEKEIIEPSPVTSNSINSSQNNNLIFAIVIGLLVALGVSGAFFLTYQMKETQARLEEIDRERKNTEVKLEEEQKKREDEELKRQQAEKMRLEAEQERTKAEQLRREAEEKASNQSVRTIVVDSSNIPSNVQTYNTTSNNSLSRIKAYIQYENNAKMARELQSYLSSLGVYFPDDIDQQNNIKQNDIRYSRSSDQNLAYQLKQEIELFYSQKNISKNFILKDLSTRGFNTPAGQVEIWISN